MDFDNNAKIIELKDKLEQKLEKSDIEVDAETVSDEINMALLEYYNDRHFNPTDDEPYEEIYAGIIVQLALSSIAKYGAEGEKSHSEGGVRRVYDNSSNYPLALTRKIIPLVKGVDI